MSDDVIVTFNCGSDTMKLGCFKKSDMSRLWYGLCERINSGPTELQIKSDAGDVLFEKGDMETGYRNAVRTVLDWMKEQDDINPVAFAHRVVHGGKEFNSSVKIDQNVIDTIDDLASLAPLHNPHNAKPIKVLMELSPDIPQVACFDTAFHTTQPEISMRYAIPSDLYEEGIQKYGFHGLSYHYINDKVVEFFPEAHSKNVLVCHLGNGASMCAIKNGKSWASTMGFTAVEGLMMGTRTGSIDPGVLLHLMMAKGYDAKDLETLLYKKSGLLGVSGISNDMRDLHASDDPKAKDAIALYAHKAIRHGGEMVATMNGLDAIVFTAGVGENDPITRRNICAGLEYLGVKIDDTKNETRGENVISTDDSKVKVFVIPTNEELVMATEAKRITA